MIRGVSLVGASKRVGIQHWRYQFGSSLDFQAQTNLTQACCHCSYRRRSSWKGPPATIHEHPALGLVRERRCRREDGVGWSILSFFFLFLSYRRRTGIGEDPSIHRAGFRAKGRSEFFGRSHSPRSTGEAIGIFFSRRNEKCVRGTRTSVETYPTEPRSGVKH